MKSKMNSVVQMAEESIQKRIFDALLAGVGIVVSIPIWVLIAVLIKLEDRGPVFYKQYRVGKDGTQFPSVKFRSMIRDADCKYGPRQASENDPRVTKVGRVLRASAMDELPQLWNIFIGDMSFVGPRALMPNEIELADKTGTTTPIQSVPGYIERHAVRPGLTGVAQVYASRDIPRRQKFRYDRFYIRKQSFLLDLKLILLSFWISFRGRWESRTDKLR